MFSICDADAATMVYVNIFFRSFSKIDDVKMVRRLQSWVHREKEIHCRKEKPAAFDMLLKGGLILTVWLAAILTILLVTALKKGLTEMTAYLIKNPSKALHHRPSANTSRSATCLSTLSSFWVASLSFFFFAFLLHLFTFVFQFAPPSYPSCSLHSFLFSFSAWLLLL